MSAQHGIPVQPAATVTFQRRVRTSSLCSNCVELVWTSHPQTGMKVGWNGPGLRVWTTKDQNVLNECAEKQRGHRDRRTLLTKTVQLHPSLTREVKTNSCSTSSKSLNLPSLLSAVHVQYQCWKYYDLYASRQREMWAWWDFMGAASYLW